MSDPWESDEDDIEDDGGEPDPRRPPSAAGRLAEAGAEISGEFDVDAIGLRLDKALAHALADHPGLSRSRLRALIEAGMLMIDGAGAPDPRAKPRPGQRFRLTLPPPTPATPAPEAIALDILFEDDALIVVDKPAGMAVHPAPGSESGTLVNALLAHCGDDLSGVGGVARPGVVHRIDKLTSGLLVVAKSDAAHQGLSALFKAHDVERRYLALVWGAPDHADPRLRGHPSVAFERGVGRIETDIARARNDRKKMAVVSAGGRRAVTRFETLERFGTTAALIGCRLETGRTHQIRVHMAHIGHPIVGDPVYGRARAISDAALDAPARDGLRGFPRQALHAETLGFRHPTTGAALRFERTPPEDMAALLAALRAARP